MSWTCPCGTSNSEDRAPCRSCGVALFYPQQPPGNWYQAPPPKPKRRFPKFLTVVFVIGASTFLVAIFSDSKSNPKIDTPATSVVRSDSGNAVPPGMKGPPSDPRQQQLADLRARREVLEGKIYIERETVKKVLSEQGIAGIPDDEHERITQLLEEKKQVDEEIALAEGKQPIVPADQEPTSATTDSNNLTDFQESTCLQTIGKRYATRLAVPVCQCLLMVYKQTGSSDRAARTLIPCVSVAMESLRNPGATVTLPWDQIAKSR